jgi:hypothetical protein
VIDTDVVYHGVVIYYLNVDILKMENFGSLSNREAALSMKDPEVVHIVYSLEQHMALIRRCDIEEFVSCVHTEEQSRSDHK